MGGNEGLHTTIDATIRIKSINWDFSLISIDDEQIVLICFSWQLTKFFGWNRIFISHETEIANCVVLNVYLNSRTILSVGHYFFIWFFVLLLAAFFLTILLFFFFYSTLFNCKFSFIFYQFFPWRLWITNVSLTISYFRWRSLFNGKCNQ